jgi:uncharacterized YigZ family protein
MGYVSPRTQARYEQEIRKSRFIGIASPARTAEEAESLIAAVGTEFEDATHRCWAYVLGDPLAAPRMRFDDAGEPAGTAGRPILGVLRSRSVGDALVSVVRYFGGAKLGAGGLVRAYSSTASRALDAAELVAAVPRVEIAIHLDYADEQAARHLLARHEAEIVSVSHSDSVVVAVRIERSKAPLLRREIAERTSGRARVETSPDAVY